MKGLWLGLATENNHSGHIRFYTQYSIRFFVLLLLFSKNIFFPLFTLADLRNHLPFRMYRENREEDLQHACTLCMVQLGHYFHKKKTTNQRLDEAAVAFSAFPPLVSSVHPSINPSSHPFTSCTRLPLHSQGHGGLAVAYPNCHGAKVGLHPGQVTTSWQGQTDRQTNIH